MTHKALRSLLGALGFSGRVSTLLGCRGSAWHFTSCLLKAAPLTSCWVSPLCVPQRAVRTCERVTFAPLPDGAPAIRLPWVQGVEQPYRTNTTGGCLTEDMPHPAYSTADSRVASVSGEGLLTARGLGSTTLTGVANYDLYYAHNNGTRQVAVTDPAQVCAPPVHVCRRRAREFKRAAVGNGKHSSWSGGTVPYRRCQSVQRYAYGLCSTGLFSRPESANMCRGWDVHL